MHAFGPSATNSGTNACLGGAQQFVKKIIVGNQHMGKLLYYLETGS